MFTQWARACLLNFLMRKTLQWHLTHIVWARFDTFAQLCRCKRYHIYWNVLPYSLWIQLSTTTTLTSITMEENTSTLVMYTWYHALSWPWESNVSPQMTCGSLKGRGHLRYYFSTISGFFLKVLDFWKIHEIAQMWKVALTILLIIHYLKKTMNTHCPLFWRLLMIGYPKDILLYLPVV